jgi:hypothetical protein
MNPTQLIHEIEQLPLEAQQQIESFIAVIQSRYAIIRKTKLSEIKKTPLEEIGFIGCGEVDKNLSVNYKEKLTDSLKEKHNL